MLDELGLSFSTALFTLISLYFAIKWAVENGINESVLGSENKIDYGTSYTDVQNHVNSIKKQSEEFKDIMKNK